MATLYHNGRICVWFFIKNSQLFFPKMPIFFRLGHFSPCFVDLGKERLSFLLYYIYPRTPKIAILNTFNPLKHRKKSRFDEKYRHRLSFWWLFLFKPMNKTRNIRRANISADHTVAINQHVCPNGPLVSLVIFDSKGVSRDILAAIFGKIEPLRLL